MTARYANAADAPKRVVYLYIHSGSPEDWRPSSASAISTSQSSYHYGPASYNVAQICHFRGVDTEVGGHGGARQALGVIIPVILSMLTWVQFSAPEVITQQFIWAPTPQIPARERA